MKRIITVLAASLLFGATPFAVAAVGSDTNNSDMLQRAKLAEQRGDLALVHSNYTQASAYYQSAVRLDRQNATLYNKLGIAELQLNQRGAARRNFEQALKCDPQSTAAVNNLGAVALRDKKFSLAVDYFKKALAMDESTASTHVNLAEAWISLKQYDRATTEYARALELDADVFSDSQGGSLIQLSSPEQRARVDFLIAKSYMKRGNLEGALDYLGRAKELHLPGLSKVYTDPDFAPLWKDPRLAKIVKPSMS
ncbi:MAG: tetratricopeptide repeat protein [Terracidiphilus sp.]|jgi:tetratricopeptide (TPR) repeat protein